MTLQRWKSLIRSISAGKQLRDAVYLHRSLIGTLPTPLKNIVEKVYNFTERPPWTILKLYKHVGKLSLLDYPTFDTAEYPALNQSMTVDLQKMTARLTVYSDRKRVPVLHRKALFLASDDPRASRFAAQTRHQEADGVFDGNKNKIGLQRKY